jgi:hypothetical protein
MSKKGHARRSKIPMSMRPMADRPPESMPGPPRMNFDPLPSPPASDAPTGETATRDELGRELDGVFFDDSLSADSPLAIEARDPRTALKLTAAAARRRAHFAKYVTLAVALAAALCAAALVKTTIVRGHDTSHSRAGSAEHR